MDYNKKADLITIGQWIESKLCFGSFEEPFTSNEKYEEIGEKFVRFSIMFSEYLMFPRKGELFDYEIHTVMKNLVSYRLTPQAIVFINYYKDDIGHCNMEKSEELMKNVMFLKDKALCNFHIYNLNQSKTRMPFHIRDYCETFENEDFVVELDGLESIEKGAGKALMEEVLYVFEEYIDIPVLLQAGFLHYGDYECEDDMKRVKELTKFYESLGFENVNHTIGCYEESVMMLAHGHKIKELEEIEKE